MAAQWWISPAVLLVQKDLLTSTNVQILQVEHRCSTNTSVEHLRRISSSSSSSSSEPPPTAATELQQSCNRATAAGRPPAQSYIAYATHAPHLPQTDSHSPFQLPLLSAPTAVANSHSMDVTNLQQAVLQSSYPTQMRAITAQQLRYLTVLVPY